MPNASKKQHVISAICKNFLYTELNEADAENILDVSIYREYKAGDIVFHKGDVSENIYVVLEGRLKIQNESKDGKTLVLDMLGPGSSFGEIGLIENKPRIAQAVCITYCKLLITNRSNFMKILAKYPHVAIKVMNLLSNKVRSTHEFLESIVFFNLGTRLAKLLKVLAKKYGTNHTESGLDFDIKISQGELANLAGSSRESVNKQLKKWEDEGLLRSLEGGKLRIDNKLLQLAD